MGQRIIRGLAIGAVLGFSLAPVAAVGATGAGGGPSGTAKPAAVTAPAPTDAQRKAWGEAVRSAPRAGGSTTSGVAGPSGPAGVAAASPAITVTPDTDLVRGQTVSVSGTDLGTSDVVLVQCQAGSTPFDCDLRNVVFATPDPSGAITVDFTVHRVIQGPAARVDCANAPGACELVAANFDAVELARHALAFDPTAPLAHPTITVTPNTDLVAGQSVTVDGAGFTPGGSVLIRECAAPATDCSDGAAFVPVDTTGAFSRAFSVSLRVRDGSGSTTHCLAVDCIVRADGTSDLEDQADAPITFDPNQPLPPVPAITVTPSTGLLHDQSATITGTGFDPDGYVQISQCGPDDGPFCGEYLVSTQTDHTGAFSVLDKVTRLVSTYGPGGPSIVDCAVDPCSVEAVESSDDGSFELVARAPIAFDDSVAPPGLPVVTVTPATNLPYRAQVAIHGTGFTPGGFVSADYCIESSEDGTCPFYTQGTADGSGTVELTLDVKRRASFGGATPIDCVDPGTQCFVSVSGQRGYESSRTEITFDPNAAIPPPPAATVTPDHDLGYRQAVAITGSGFTPGPVGVQECAEVEEIGGSFFTCVGFTELEADADGAISGNAEVRRVLSFGTGFSVDCATSASPCTLRIGSGDLDESAIVPLGFDPNSQPPPPPVVVVSPGMHIRAGQEVIVGGVGFAANALLGLAPCRAGVTAIADSCDIGRAGVATTNANGGFLTSTTAVGVIQTSQGPVDCTAAADACVLAVANAADLSEFAVASMSFDAPELMVHSVTLTEGTGDMTPAHVMVELSEPTLVPITVEWQAIPGTATTDDFRPTRGRVTIPAGAAEAMVHVDVVGDAIDEPTERFTVNLTDAPGTHIADGTATVKIRDDDRQPRITIGDFSTTEGDAGTSLGYIPVWLDGPSGRDIVIEYRTHHGSARSGSDFVRSRGEITIPAGRTGGFITVPIVGDGHHERTESFRVELRDAENATIGDDSATETIFDDD